MKLSDISIALKKSGIKKSDTLMIHGDAGITAQLNVKKKIQLDIFFNQIIKYIGKQGNLLIPAFTYSFCKTRKFNVQKTKSEVGLFSENFRKRKDVYRTLHPIFSFSIYGKNFSYFKNADIHTCFGNNSIFDLFNKADGKIICMGVDFEITYLHYIEELFNVKYRYYKLFHGIITNYKSNFFTTTKYFVRDLKKKNKINFKKIFNELLKKKKIKIVSFGRYFFLTIKEKTLFNYCIKNLKKNNQFLVR